MDVRRVFIGNLMGVERAMREGGIKAGNGVYLSEIVTGTARLDTKRP
jgi:hypothetical protein